MASGGSSTVFFLGTKAHYQVLQQPENPSSMDNSNGNTPESVYQHLTPAQDIWNQDVQKNEENSNYVEGECSNWINCGWKKQNDCRDPTSDFENGNTEFSSKVTRRLKKKSTDGANEKILNDNEDTYDYDPSVLNNMNQSQAKKSGRCVSIKALLQSLKSKGSRKLTVEELECIQNVESVLTMCTYKECCRCLDCQSRYFECDDDDEYDYDSEDYDYDDYDYYDQEPEMLQSVTIENPSTSKPREADAQSYDEDNEEVFIDIDPQGNRSTDNLIERSKSQQSVTTSANPPNIAADKKEPLPLEMAAGTPVVLDYILNHPITCALQ